MTFLGHVVSENGVKTDPVKTRAVEEWKSPENVSDLRSFLGLVSYYRKFIKNFSAIVKCLNAPTSKNARWEWTNECENAFQILKSKLVTASILGYPDTDGDVFILDTDASNGANGAVLPQIQDGKEIIIEYASRNLNSSEKSYCHTKRNVSACVFR